MSYDSAFGTNGSEPERDRWGRRLFDLGNGKKIATTGVTTLASTIEDRHHLEKYLQRTLLYGASLRPDITAAARVTDPSEKGKYESWIEDALAAAGSGAKANAGTGFHGALRMAVDGASPDEIPEEYHSAISQTLSECERLGVTLLGRYAERYVVNTRVGANGQLDYLAEVGGHLMVVDVKTGNLDYVAVKAAPQLAVYARADILISPDGRPIPMPDVHPSIGLVIHVDLDTGTPTINSVDLDAGWHAAVLATQVRAYRRRDDLMVPFTGAQFLSTVSPPVAPPAPPLTETLSPQAQAVQERAGNVQAGLLPDGSGPLPTEQPAADPVAAGADVPPVTAEQLKELVRGRKGTAQAIARRVMAGGPEIKLTQYVVKICADILSHPNWPAHAAGELNTITGDLGEDRVLAILASEHQPESAETQVEPERHLSAVPSETPATGPFTAAEPVRTAPASPEQIILDEIAAVLEPPGQRGWPAMDKVWQHATMNGGPGWTPLMQKAALARGKELSAS